MKKVIESARKLFQKLAAENVPPRAVLTQYDIDGKSPRKRAVRHEKPQSVRG